MMCQQAALDAVKNMIDTGVELPHGSNPEMIRCMGFMLVEASIPASVRKQLNQAVKAGYLGRLKKDGLLPEAFFHPNSKANALEARRRKAGFAIKAITAVCVSHSKFDA
jgi:hypothetical protein